MFILNIMYYIFLYILYIFSYYNIFLFYRTSIVWLLLNYILIYTIFLLPSLQSLQLNRDPSWAYGLGFSERLQNSHEIINEPCKEAARPFSLSRSRNLSSAQQAFQIFTVDDFRQSCVNRLAKWKCKRQVDSVAVCKCSSNVAWKFWRILLGLHVIPFWTWHLCYSI